jgi:disulfide bond formation protein DsbB
VFHRLHSLSQRRLPWLLLAASAALMESFALYMQHVHGLEPCNECIYIRVGILAIAAAGLLGAVAPRVAMLRWSALALWLGGLGWSLYRTHLLLDLEHRVREGAQASCGRFKGFAQWMPLDQWLPDMFEPRAMCGAVDWTFLGQSFTVWSGVALWGLAGAAALVVLAQFQRRR